MTLRELIPVLPPYRTIWIEDEVELETNHPCRLSQTHLDKEVKWIYPANITMLGGINVVVVQVKNERRNES